jgi:glycogen debranching enzyme
LKAAINRSFYDPQAGLYAAYLLADVGQGVRVHRYDLLGESLAILSGVADDATTKVIIRHYPIGPFGPPVVWPQERTVPIFHNQAIWPFVTAFWIEAARKAGNAAAVDEGIHSLMRGAAFNLSNMENYDFVNGKAQVKDSALNGPVINSRRQLWSVAGYLAMVQNVVFGLETSHDGIRFRPFVTERLRNDIFGATDNLELQNFSYRGKTIQVRVHLPQFENENPALTPLAELS